MKLHDFDQEMCRLAMDFVKQWEKKNEFDQDNFPLELQSVDEWMEQFIIFIEETYNK